MLPGKKTADYRWVLKNIPLAMQASAGDVQGGLELEIEKIGIKLNAKLACESFPQACRAVSSLEYAAILPTLAAVDLNSDDFLELPLPVLKAHERMICLAWNLKLIRIRSDLEKIIGCFKEALAA